MSKAAHMCQTASVAATQQGLGAQLARKHTQLLHLHASFQAPAAFRLEPWRQLPATAAHLHPLPILTFLPDDDSMVEGS